MRSLFIVLTIFAFSASNSFAGMVGMYGTITSSSGTNGIFGTLEPNHWISLDVTNGGGTNIITSWTLTVPGHGVYTGSGFGNSISLSNPTATLNVANSTLQLSGTVSNAPFTGTNSDFTQPNLNLINGVATVTFIDFAASPSPVTYTGLVAVPEPMSIISFAAATLVGIVAWRRRRVKA